MLPSDNKIEYKTSIIVHCSIKLKTDYNPFEINNLYVAKLLMSQFLLELKISKFQ